MNKKKIAYGLIPLFLIGLLLCISCGGGDKTITVKASDGIPYHLRLVQPLQVPGQADLYVTATLFADRSTRVRFGIQDQSAPFRVVHVGALQIGTSPRRLRLHMTNPHPDLRAQVQLDLGYCVPGTTVWLSNVTVRGLRATK